MTHSTRLPAVATALVVAALSFPALAGDVLFTAGSLPTNFGPIDVAAADLDGDGDLDLVVAESFFNQVSVRLGDGAGGFAPASVHPVGAQPQSLLLAHMDGDGLLDLVTAEAGAGSVSVSRGLGGGAFAAAVPVGVGTQPRGLACGDIDADGDLDVVVAHDSLATPVCVLLNDGAGVLTLASVLPPGFSAAAVALADVAGDALPELLVCDATNARLAVWERDGGADGGFLHLDAVVLPAAPGGLDVADLDGDGRLDAVVALAGGASLARMLGMPGGGFGPPQLHPTGNTPSRLRLADVDGDERLDAVSISALSNALTTLVGDGAGGFAAPVTLATGSFPTGLTVADLDGDFFPDVAVANSFGTSLSVYIAGAGPWVDLGGGVDGAWGPAFLEASGSLVPRQAVVLVPHGAPAVTPGLLFLGLTRLDAPFFGGTLVPQVSAALNVRAEVPTSFKWPEHAPPGLVVYLQAWFQVGGTAGGTVVGTDALRAVTQSP